MDDHEFNTRIGITGSPPRLGRGRCRFEACVRDQINGAISVVEANLTVNQKARVRFPIAPQFNKELDMKTITFENIWSKEKFECSFMDLKNPEVIEGVEYLRVAKAGTGRLVLMRKDALKKIKEAKM